jgi:hypothetical protein
MLWVFCLLDLASCLVVVMPKVFIIGILGSIVFSSAVSYRRIVL